MAVCIYLELLITSLVCLLEMNSFECNCPCQIKFQISGQGRSQHEIILPSIYTSEA